ncbi:MAG: FtsW/RodA/SpoVE family cell cycle protein [Rhodothermaceae bacterium]|nr:FtsW/RodA/SpoVE family cell cycle protein [Rhodothermaceae bacterium]
MKTKRPSRAKSDSLPPPDKYVVWVVLVLAAVGILAVYSAIAFLAETKAGGNTERFLLRHTMYVAVSLAAMVGFSRLDYRVLVKYAKPALITLAGLLLLVQFVGVTSGGAQRAFRLGIISFQPSEIAKVALLLYVALLIAKKQTYIESFSRAFTPLFFWIFLTVLLIGIEDLSTASLVLLATIVMCFVGRVHIVQLTGLGVLMVLLATMFLLTSPSRMDRLEQYFGTTLVETEENTIGDSYQSHQARIAFAMGGLTGKGPGKSTQRDFLPAPYNDFIFAIIAEEYGLLGALGLLALFSIILLRGYLSIARRAADPLGLILAVGLTTLICLYGFVHAAVACGLLPVTGLPMPFVSYGGTSMLANGIMVGILLSISRYAVRDNIPTT